jgi:hypothetical protein
MRVKYHLFVLGLMLFACGTNGETPTLPPMTEVVQSSPTAEASPTATKVPHVMIPGELPTEPNGIVGDQDSSVTADEKRAPSGDRFTFSRFERPFNANAMDVYFPSIDIQGAKFFQDDTWLYVEIQLKDTGEADYSLDGKYGFEIDLDTAGGGDLLVLASQPASNEWSTSGVEVWADINDDVGGLEPTITDKTPSVYDGYENLMFGDSTFSDPDLAWVRVSPADPYRVQIAVKQDILKGDKTFLVGVWAGNEDLTPALFDINDLFTHEQAGTSVAELPNFYPIKEVSELDNTCRMAIGYQPRGNEPGLCPLPSKPGEESPLEPGGGTCPQQYVVCFPTGNQVICLCAQP